MDLSTINWGEVSGELNGKGIAHLRGILTETECENLQSLYSDERNFRNVINMQRYRFGKGEYKYFNYPLPKVIDDVRKYFYQGLVPVANSWMQSLDIDIKYPDSHEAFIKTCQMHSQSRPTPLILRYEKGGYNTLHQDLYGEVYFPFQVVFVLTKSGIDHTGGELVFVEQLPRAQSRAEVMTPDQGDAIIFTTNFRPAIGTRGFYRARMKHGVSPVRSGVRYALGVIFHDAS